MEPEDEEELQQQAEAADRKKKGGGKAVKQLHPATFCAVIRHGERVDNVDWQSMGLEMEEVNDPGLTPLGIQQSKETAQFLKAYLAENGYEDIVIESSPYLRAL